MVKNKSNLTFTFEGGYAVEITAVAKAFDALATMTKLTADYQYPDITYTVAVKALSPGSLEIEFEAIAEAAKTIFNKDNIQYAENLLSAIVSYFMIKQLLKGNRPAKREKRKDFIEITSEDGTKFTVPAASEVYFIDNRIDNSLTNIFESIKTSETVTGVKIVGGNSSCVQIPKQEFEVCAKAIDFDTEAETNTKVVNTRSNEILFVRKPDLIGDTQWLFKSDKNIPADIKDEAFLMKVKSGSQKICAGMYIVADLEVEYLLDKNGMPIESSCKYTVVSVSGVHLPDEGQSFLTDL